jgi:hypothetical protein
VAPSFVNFDRYLNANKGALDAQRAKQQASVNSRFDALNTGLQTVQGGVSADAAKGTPQGPVGTQLPSDAQARTAMTYSGPSQGQVDSRYAPLLAERDRLAAESRTGGPATGNAFDRALGSAAGKVSYGGLEGAQKAYDASYNASTDTINKAGATAADNASRWQKLLDFETENARKQEAHAVQQRAVSEHDAGVRNAWVEVQKQDLLERQGFSTEAVNEIARAVKQGTMSIEDLDALNKAAAAGGDPGQLSNLWVNIKKRLRGGGRGNEVRIVGQG